MRESRVRQRASSRRLAPLAVAALVGMVFAGPVSAAEPPIGETIYASNATTGTTAAIRPDGTGLTTLPCTGDRSHLGVPRRVVRLETTDGATRILSTDESCVDARVLWAPGPGYAFDWATWSLDGARVAAGGRHLASDGRLLEAGIWVIEVTSGCDGACPAHLAAAFSSPSDAVVAYTVIPRWSSDGRRVTYNHDVNTGGTQPLSRIFVADLGAPGDTAVRPERLVAVSGTHLGQFQPQFSPVADLILYTENTPKGGPVRNELFVVAASGGTPRQLTSTKLASAGAILHPTWSPDGQWIAFSGTPNGGQPSIYRMRSDGSAKAVLVLATDRTIYYAPAWRR